MKKYCFTDCFKRKMSVTGDILLQLGVFVLLAIAATTALLIAVGMLGLISQSIAVYFLGNLIHWPVDIMEAGVASILSVVFIAAAIIVLYLAMSLSWVFLKWAYRGLYNFGERLFGEEKFECNIFEECKDV